MGWAGVGVAAVVIVGVGGYLAYEATKSPSSTTTSSSTSSTASMSTSTTPVITSSATGPSQVKIGAALPLSGMFAEFGQPIMWSAQQAVADLNAQGGINVNGKKVPVTYTAYDDTSNLTQTSALTDKLILEDNVDIFCCGNTGPTAEPMSIEAERYGVPLIVGAPFESWWADGPYKYAWSILFRIATPAPGYPQGYTISDNFGGLASSITSQTNAVATVLALNDPDGAGFYDGYSAALKSLGYSVVDTLLYPPGTTDFSSQITKWKSDDVQVIFANLDAPDCGTFWRQSSELNWRPKMAMFSRAADFYGDVEAWGDNLAFGVCCEQNWNPSWPATGIGTTTPQSLAAAWISHSGQPVVNPCVGFGYSSVQIAADAITRAGTVDRDAVNTAVGETNLNAMTGPIKFTSTHDSPCPITVGQWQGTSPNFTFPAVYSLVSIFPTTGQFTFPLPAWS